MQRFGASPIPSVQYKRRPGAYAILANGDDILVTLQEYPDAEFQLPGGGIDAGEHPIRALHREVFEETGWRISMPRRIGAFRRYTYMPEYNLFAEKICTIYTAHPVRRQSDPTEDGHIAVWMKIPEALELLGNEGDRYFLDWYYQFITRNRR